MKKVILWGLLFSSFCLPVFAFQNEPTGFRGVGWGDKIDCHPQMILLRDHGDGTVGYFKSGEKYSIEEVRLKSIIYVFWQDRFAYVVIFYSGRANWERLKDILLKNFGEGEEISEFLLYWEGKNRQNLLRF